MAPRLTAEYDKVTNYLHSLTVEYNRRLAAKNGALTTVALKNLISDELQSAGFFVDRAFHFREDAKTEEALVPKATAGKGGKVGRCNCARNCRRSVLRTFARPLATSPTPQTMARGKSKSHLKSGKSSRKVGASTRNASASSKDVGGVASSAASGPPPPVAVDVSSESPASAAGGSPTAVSGAGTGIVAARG